MSAKYLRPELLPWFSWFSLAHKHKHKRKDMRTRRTTYLTQFSMSALLNPVINKTADEASAILLLICSHEVWVKVTYDWSGLVHGLVLMSVAKCRACGLLSWVRKISFKKI